MKLSETENGLIEEFYIDCGYTNNAVLSRCFSNKVCLELYEI